MVFSGSYNLKIIEFPNGSTQLRFYKNGLKLKKNRGPILDDVEESILPVSDLIIDSNFNRSVASSLNRSKNTLYSFARCNKWDLFLTLTFDTRYDRTDYSLLLKMLRKWLNNLKRVCPDLGYIVVPEEHKRLEENGKHAYHFHALFCNCEELTLEHACSPSGRKLYTKSGLPIYNIKNYHFGFSTATYVTDTYRVTNYITKYITKALCIRQKNKRRFLTSHNLLKPTVHNVCISNFDDIYRYYAIDFEKVVDVKCGAYEDTVTYLEVSKMENISTSDIINALTTISQND